MRVLFNSVYVKMTKWLGQVVTSSQPLITPSAARLIWAWLLLQRDSINAILPSKSLLNQLSDIWFYNDCCDDQWVNMPHWINILHRYYQEQVMVDRWFDIGQASKQVLDTSFLQHKQSDAALIPPFSAVQPPWIPPLWQQIGLYWQSQGVKWHWWLPATSSTTPVVYECTEHHSHHLLRDLVRWIKCLPQIAQSSSIKVAVVVANRVQAKQLQLQLDTVLPLNWRIIGHVSNSWQDLIGWSNIHQYSVPQTIELTSLVEAISQYLLWHDNAIQQHWLRLTQDLMLSASQLGAVSDAWKIQHWLKLLANETISLSKDLITLYNRDTYGRGGSKHPQQHIQIITLEEAWGGNWDYLWLWQLDRQTLALISHTPTLVPNRLQAEWQIPVRNNVSRNQYIAQLADYLFTHTTTQIIIGSYLNNPDGSHHLPSVLWDQYRNCQVLRLPSLASRSNKFAELPLNHAISSDRVDNYLSKADCQYNQVNIHWLTSHSRCALRAYLNEALDLRGNKLPIAQSQKFITSVIKSKLLHGVLTCIWQQIDSLDNLHQLSIEQSCCLIQDALTQTAGRLAVTLTNSELLYFQQIFEQYLLLEKKRAPFKVITVSQKRTVTVNNIEIPIYIDRIDELTDGKRILVNYTTGLVMPTPRQWLTVPMRNPRIPLCCIALQEQPITQLISWQIHSSEHLTCKSYTMHDIHALAVKLQLISKDSSLIEWWLMQIKDIVQNIVNSSPIADSNDAEYCRSCPYLSCCNAPCKI